MKRILILMSAVILSPALSLAQDVTTGANAPTASSSETRIDRDYNLKTEAYLGAIDTSKSKDRDVPWFVERYKISAGFYSPFSNTTIRVGTDSGNAGTSIDLEKDLGFKTNTESFLGNFQWRISSRSRLDLSYYYIRRNSSRTLERTIEFGDQTYEVNTSISSFFNTEIYRLSYGYAIISKPTYEIGALIGFHIIGADMGLNAKANNQQIERNSDFGFTAPLPDFGIWGGYAISPRFSFNGEIDFLSVKINNFKGRILAYDATFTYMLAKHWNLTAGYTGLNVRVDVERDNRNGHFVWSYNGPSLMVTYVFGRKKWH